ncbi:MAG: hypothetical protein ACWA44_15470 [Thiotrichales bacterium]
MTLDKRQPQAFYFIAPLKTVGPELFLHRHPPSHGEPFVIAGTGITLVIFSGLKDFLR